MFIYVIVNRATLKIYIGQHKGRNLRQYLQQKLFEARHCISARSVLYASMRKHPRDVWSIHPLVVDLQTRKECDDWEQHYIRVLKTQHPDVGYNICRGGEGFTGPHTEQACQKISAALAGRPHTAEHIAHAAAARRGISTPKSQEFRARVSKTLMGRRKTVEHARHIGEGHRRLVYNLGNCWNLGRKQSSETIAKRKMSNAGFRHTEIAAQKMRRPKSPEVIEHMRAAQQARRLKER